MTATVAVLKQKAQAPLNLWFDSIATMSPNDEAAALTERFNVIAGRMPKSVFAQRFGLPGGASMLSQHLSGNRPMSLEAAMAYARGFAVPLGGISQRLADQVRAAADLLGDAAQRPLSPQTAWPFRRISADEWAALDDYDRVLVEAAAAEKLRELRAERAPSASDRRSTVQTLVPRASGGEGGLVRTPAQAERRKRELAVEADRRIGGRRANDLKNE